MFNKKVFRQWLVIIDKDNEPFIQGIKEGKIVYNLQELRVALLSGEYNGVGIYSVQASDLEKLISFVNSVNSHPQLKQVQLVISSEYKECFKDGAVGKEKFFSKNQIKKLVGIDSEEEDIPVTNVKSITGEDSQEGLQDGIEFLKHISAKAISEIIINEEGELPKNDLLEKYLEKLKNLS